METIMKIPLLLALLASLLTGLISILNHVDTNHTCVRMIIALVSFYIIGSVISWTLSNIMEEQNELKREAEMKLKEQERLEMEQALKAMQKEHLGGNLDLVADNKLDNDFSPLDLTQAIRGELNK